MKTLKTILNIAFFGLTFSAVAQNNARLEKVKSITDYYTVNLDKPQYGDDEMKTKENISLYTEYYKQGDYVSTLPFWRYVMLNAPKQSVNLYIRGLAMYKDFAEKATGEQKEAYIDTALALMDARIAAFGSTTNLETKKAYEWHDIRYTNNEAFIFELFTKTYQKHVEEGVVNEVEAAFLSPWVETGIFVNKNAKTVSEETVLDIFEKVTAIAEENIKAEKDAENYSAALNAVTEMLNKGDYLNCEKLMPIVEKAFKANPDDEATIVSAYNKLKNGGCTDNALFTNVIEKLVKVRPSTNLYKFLASKAQKAGSDSQAIGYINKAIEMETDKSEKAKMYYQIARIHSGNGSYSNARDYARKALDIIPNYGEAYILIGSTYASSGSICGSGTDFKSHTVAWAAIDVWQKAKAVDPGVAAEAQSLINKYSQYMPSKEELFYEGIAIGSTYTISCLGVTTTVRASN
jgi:tetratricopeptide (TPR) repeat protein